MPVLKNSSIRKMQIPESDSSIILLHLFPLYRWGNQGLQCFLHGQASVSKDTQLGSLPTWCDTSNSVSCKGPGEVSSKWKQLAHLNGLLFCSVSASKSIFNCANESSAFHAQLSRQAQHISLPVSKRSVDLLGCLQTMLWVSVCLLWAVHWDT